ncbi:MAG TPA: hypothetical protein VI758_09220 [Bacteroidota bacterium]
MKPIWYFVGLLLLIIGSIILLAGAYTLVNPPPQEKVLAGLHADLWWGAVMIIGGLTFLLANRKKKVG